ncbi:hypothetical protein Hanom_Chr13g01186981 [Helianthus anomalus]
MFIHLTKRTEIVVCVRLFNKRMNTNELPLNCSSNVWFVCSPKCMHFNHGIKPRIGGYTTTITFFGIRK